MRAAALLAASLFFVACGSDDDPSPRDVEDTEAPLGTGTADTGDTGMAPSLCDDAPVVTWENFGAGFVTQNCQACHASGAVARNGAPEAVTFDSEEDTLSFAERILSRVVDTPTMPPQGGVTDDDRYFTEVWLRCD